MAGLFGTNLADILAGNVTTRAAALATYFTQATTESPLVYAVGQLGPKSLASQRYLSHGLQYFMETDQWQNDVVHWWDIAMARRQQALLAHAYYNPADPATLAQLINFTTPELKKVCNSQVSAEPSLSFVPRLLQQQMLRSNRKCEALHTGLLAYLVSYSSLQSEAH